MKNEWQKTATEVMKSLGTTENGLDDAESARRLEKWGPNELETKKRKSAALIFAEQFKDFLVIVLICAAAVSACVGDVSGAAVICAVITMNAVLGTVQTIKANSSLESLKKMSAPTAKVRRGGKTIVVPAREVTVGDVILLESGDMVCADARIVRCASLKCSESVLTGESVPVEKTSDAIEDTAALGDRRNMVFSGCFVSYGRGEAVVTAIGEDTQMGKIATLLKNTKENKTPLQMNLDVFGRRLTIAILVLCGVIFALGIFVQKRDLVQTFLFATALAVAAIPEALSSIVTIVLSFGTQKMAKEHAVVRKLHAVEGLGSVSVICTDKTGTLTQNKMTVKKIYANGCVTRAEDVQTENPYEKALIETAILCSDAVADENGEVGDATEAALVRLGGKVGIDSGEMRRKYPRVGEIPFDSDRKMMSTVHDKNGSFLMVTKGAVDVLTDRCILTEEEKREIEKVNESFSREGLRVLAFASKSVERAVADEKCENDLTFLGLAAMIDPPREESRDAVAECVKMGIRPVMITGDHKITASAVAKEIGILSEDTIAAEGSETDSMTDEELMEFVPRVSVFARVSPEHKIRIVRAWQARGNIVSMTGDGVNDAPALKQADVGVAMGITGTEVSKDAADMVLTDDNFATIVKAVKNGRNLYANIKKAIGFLISGNAAAILTVLYASVMNLPTPFAAVQLLFINLLTDSLPAIALGLEPHSESVVNDKPRGRKESILTGDFVKRVITEGCVIACATVAAFYTGLKTDAMTGSSMAFATLCLSRLLHSFTSKSKKSALLERKMTNNKYLNGAVAAGAVLLGSVMFVPFLGAMFAVAEFSAINAAWVAVLSIGTMIANQILRTIA